MASLDDVKQARKRIGDEIYLSPFGISQILSKWTGYQVYIDVNILSRIIERGLAQDGRLVRLMVAVPDAPGALHEVSGQIAKCRGNIVDVRHDRAFSNVPVGIAHVIFTIETRGREHIEEIKTSVADAGFGVEELE